MKTELLIGIILLLILSMFLNPTHLLMPETFNMLLIVGLIIGFLGFIALVWRERASDEREALHMAKAGRISFFAGTATLVVGIAIQALQHEIDPWLLYALSIMVMTKILSRILDTLRN